MTLRGRRRATRDGHIRKHTGPTKTRADGADRFEVCTLVDPRAKSGNQLIDWIRVDRLQGDVVRDDNERCAIRYVHKVVKIALILTLLHFELEARTETTNSISNSRDRGRTLEIGQQGRRGARRDFLLPSEHIP